MQLCQIHNCVLQQRGTSAALVCPLCEMGVTFANGPTIAMPSYGCICPPGANLQCNNPVCPRNPPDMRPTGHENPMQGGMCQCAECQRPIE